MIDASEDGLLRLPPIPLIIGLLVATSLSVGMVWLLGSSGLIATAYAGGLLTILVGLLLVTRLRSPLAVSDLAPPDWSVTHAAIENKRHAIAITDRANRLTCANSTYRDWFGIDAEPQALELDDHSREAANDAARAAWRDGRGSVDLLRLAQGERTFRLAVERSGRGENYLIWRFTEIIEHRSYDGVAESISGSFGATMSRA